MKLLYLFAVALIPFSFNTPHHVHHYKLKLTGDSGYILKNAGVRFLLAYLNDTSNEENPAKLSDWDMVKENDTIGKYYREPGTGNYIFCLIDLSSKPFESHIVIEVNGNGEFLKAERFYHGNYPCCWDNYYEGFSRYGNYFGIKTCGTGLAYCASYLWLFKTVMSQDSLKSILISSFAAGSAMYGESLMGKLTGDDYIVIDTTWKRQPEEFLESELMFNNNSLVIHYTLEDALQDDSLNVETTRAAKLDVHFTFNNNKWLSDDTTGLVNDEQK